jgi:hypothetical protein
MAEAVKAVYAVMDNPLRFASEAGGGVEGRVARARRD